MFPNLDKKISSALALTVIVFLSILTAWFSLRAGEEIIRNSQDPNGILDLSYQKKLQSAEQDKQQ
jgi:hypothetical protein